MVKELTPIVLSCAVWGNQLSGKQVLFECDNSSVVMAVNQHYTQGNQKQYVYYVAFGFSWHILTLT